MARLGMEYSPMAYGIGGSIKNRYWTPLPMSKDINYWVKDRSGNTIPDSIGGNDAKILPAVFKGNSTAYYSYGAGLFISNDWVLYFNMEITDTISSLRHCLFSQNGAAGMYFRYSKTENQWQFGCTDGTHTRNITISVATLPVINRKYTFKIIHDQDGSTTIYESGNNVGSASGTFTNVVAGYTYWGTREGFEIIPSQMNLIDARVYSNLTETTLVGNYIFTGQVGVNLFDISGNLKTFTQTTVIAANSSYSINGSTYLLDSGYALWQKSGSIDIYVPYGGIATAPAAGYTLTKIYLGSVTKINMAPCLVGYNETGSVASALEIFDRSNTTRQEDISRSSSYYDATSLATKCRYHISEVYPDEILQGWFKVGYKNRIFTAISKNGSDFSLTNFMGYVIPITGGRLTPLKNFCQINGLLTVGTGKNVMAIAQAVTRAYDGYTITIDAGIYDELVDLTTKKLNFVGLGNLNTIIYPQYPASYPAYAAVRINKDCTFVNVLFDIQEAGSSSNIKPILQINGCNPVFTDCQIGRITTDSTKSVYPADISNGSIVIMNNCAVYTTTSTDDLSNKINFKVAGASTVNFEGTYFSAHLLVLDTSVINLNVDEIFSSTANETLQGIYGEDNANITVNIREEGYVYAVIIENVSFTCRGNLGIVLDVRGTGNTVLLKDIITNGRFWVITSGAAGVGSVITLDNVNVYYDVDDDISGMHIIEEVKGAEVRIINGCRLEFSGHDGLYHTMGQPVTVVGRLFMRNSTVIDNCNDNIPYGPNYQATIITWNNFDIEDCVITNQHWDHVGANVNISFHKPDGQHVTGRVHNTILNNSEINGSAFALNDASTELDDDDYLCLNNVEKNSSGAWMETLDAQGPAAYALLTENCPN